MFGFTDEQILLNWKIQLATAVWVGRWILLGLVIASAGGWGYAAVQKWKDRRSRLKTRYRA